MTALGPIEIDDAASAALERLASARSTTTAALAREAIELFVAHEAWFVTEVKAGQAAAARGDIIEHPDVARKIEALLDEPR